MGPPEALDGAPRTPKSTHASLSVQLPGGSIGKKKQTPSYPERNKGPTEGPWAGKPKAEPIPHGWPHASL